MEDSLCSFKVDVRIVGVGYKEINFIGKKYCEEKGIEIYYNCKNYRFSSSVLRNQVKEPKDK